MKSLRVFIIAATSADGYIARSKNERVDWTSALDKRHFAKLTTEAGVVIMGHNTFRAIGGLLPNRLNVIYSKDPGKIPATEGSLVTNLPPHDLLEKLQKKGFRSIAIIGGGQINDLFLEADVVSELYITVTPQLFGSGIPLTKTQRKLSLIDTRLLGQDEVLLHYKIVA